MQLAGEAVIAPHASHTHVCVAGHLHSSGRWALQACFEYVHPHTLVPPTLWRACVNAHVQEVNFLRGRDTGKNKIDFVDIADASYDPASNAGITFEQVRHVAAKQGRAPHARVTMGYRPANAGACNQFPLLHRAGRATCCIRPLRWEGWGWGGVGVGGRGIVAALGLWGTPAACRCVAWASC